MVKRLALAMAAGACILLPACSVTHNVKVDPIEVKEIHMTVDINLKVDKALDDFFDFEDKAPAPGAGGDK